ncbi:hypothetical protein G7081_06705 [Vagococcus coleopterorum]|uniref:Uncharacterized protein n=1 Tax=Vagococcus coleopterorum TaxID=2714946 RepID=A0A6G8AP50_9ENTE|nr:hypothetical protein [Vagococcus coleopterorum]QIL46776.1 hypothetical protein G7081_06705 [Vagococcus coleopterorum]
MEQTLFLISIAVLFLGFAFLGLSGGIFRLRALTNKKAWDGWTKPFLLIGAVLFLVGLVLVYIFYPYK